MALLLLANGPQQTTSAFAVVTTGTAIKTLLQIKPSATLPAKIVEWGISFDGSAAATPIKCELIEVDVAATVTAYSAADITKLDGEALACGDVTTNLIVVGTSGSGFTATAEGSITACRNLAGPQLVSPTNQFIQQFPLDAQPVIQVGKWGRIRVTSGSAVNAWCYCVVKI